ncbi:ATP-dependent sacrificial sulfur transferase LarE [candidate division KSB1 bacterium]|nr:ATP-dependent sacrificial sulfur transferase LarE [candidate division KSB1 bacterium]
MNLDKKYLMLQNILREMKGVVIGFSGGVDSTLLLKVASDILKDRAIGVIAVSFSFPEHELDEAKDIGKQIGANLRIINTEEGNNPQYLKNPINRCYFCRSELFVKMSEIAEESGITFLADGTNTDDDGDYRPGNIAQKKYAVRSPLREADLNKNEIRMLSRRLGLSTYDKPAFSCLASRIPYGFEITKGKLYMIEKAELFLRDLGFVSVRVRHYDVTARIEVGSDELAKIMEESLRDKIIRRFKELGFTYVTLDLEGFRSGSMNEVLAHNQDAIPGTQ